MELGEFLEAYSDDLISLHEARLALLSHPLRSEDAVADLVNASFCRMLAVIVVGNIEAMLTAWLEHDRVNVLEKYFEKGVQNGERIRSLRDAFLNANISVEPAVFDDYLAIKYMRNTIIHGKWKDHEQEWVASQGFPTDSRKLTIEHWGRIQDVNRSMMLYIAITKHVAPDSGKPDAVLKLEHFAKKDDEHLGIISQRDLDSIIWLNLERIHAVFGVAICEASILPEYDWTAGQSVEELQALPSVELKRRMYLAARRAGTKDCERLVRHRDLCETALQFWREYCQRISVRSGLNDHSVVESLAVFDSADFDPKSPHWRLLQAVRGDAAHELLRRLWPKATDAMIGETVSAFNFGRHAWKLFPNLMPVDLLGIQLPIVDPARTAEYSREFDSAYNAVRLGRLWYHCIENQEVFNSENLDLNRRLRSEFSMH